MLSNTIKILCHIVWVLWLLDDDEFYHLFDTNQFYQIYG